MEPRTLLVHSRLDDDDAIGARFRKLLRAHAGASGRVPSRRSGRRAVLADGRTHCDIIFTDPSRFDRRARGYPEGLIAALDNLLREPPFEGSNWIWWLQPA